MTDKKDITTREAWLEAAASLYAAELFKPAGFKVPAKRKLSVGFPYGKRGGKRQHAIGECWSAECSAGGLYEIFISPEIEDAARASDILIHELVHATVGISAKHGPEFKRCALAVGLDGKMTATVAGEELSKTLKGLLKQLPAYPHKALTPSMRSGPKKQTTRLIKLVCGQCGYTVRTTQKWLDMGTPFCPCGGEIIPEDADPGDDDDD
jgi:hypothetical protein